MILVFGVAGSGKSTQGQLLAAKYEWRWLSMGQILREELAEGPLADHINSGKLLDDTQTTDILSKKLSDIPVSDFLILDGFPRRLSQAQWLINVLKNHSQKVLSAIHLEATNESVKERLLNRGRQDDIPEAISERFEEYELQIKPILSFLEAQGVPIVSVNAEQSPQHVHEDIINGLKSAGVVK
jgi:adenylate kinase